MKNLKELAFVFGAAAPYIALIWYLKHGYTMNDDLFSISIVALIMHGVLLFIYIYKTYGSNVKS